MATLTNIYQVATISDTTGTTFISHVCMLKPSDTQMTLTTACVQIYPYSDVVWYSMKSFGKYLW